MKAQDKFTYLLAGLGLGALVGVIFAPKSGAETRGLIVNKAGEGKDFLVRQGERIRDAASDALEKGKNLVTSQKDRIAEAYEAGRQAYRDAVKEPT